MIEPANEASPAAWLHAFHLLATAELGDKAIVWSPASSPHLRARVEFLAVSLQVLPRSEVQRLDAVIEHWQTVFASEATISHESLRRETRRFLHESANEDLSLRGSEEFSWLPQTLGLQAGCLATNSSPPRSEFARKHCAQALEAWCRKVRTDPEWTHLLNVVPGQPRIPISEAYVDLRVQRRTERDGWGAMPALQRTSSGGGAYDLGSMVSQSFQNCVLLGEPGSGKSTIVQWLTWATLGRKLTDFDGAVTIPLRQYAQALQRRPGMKLLEYFLESLGESQFCNPEVAECLRSTVAAHNRFLLLLDGWDEVPSGQRREVAQAIDRERAGFLVLLTSRVSGSPWELFAGERTDYFEVAGFSELAMTTYVEKQLQILGRPERGQAILTRLRNSQEFLGLTANPFLLGLLVRVLAEHPERLGNLARAELYEQLLQWIVEQQNLGKGSDQQIVGEHMRALERLSYRLVMEGASPEFVFTRAELDQVAAHAEPIVGSRFVYRLDPVFDRWGFLHATLQEALAARHLSKLPPVELAAAWERALLAQSRLVTLGFVAGWVDGMIQQGLIEKWVEHPDRFHTILARLGMIAARSGWPERNHELGKRIEEQLWNQLTSEQNWERALPLVLVLLELNPRGVVERAAAQKTADTRIWEALCDRLPPELIRESALFARLPAALRELVLTRDERTQSNADVAGIVTRLNDLSQSDSEYSRLLLESGCVVDSRIAECLLEIIPKVEDARFESTLVMALAKIYDALPAERSLDILTEVPCFPATLRRIAATALAHQERNDGRLLDTAGRDRLLRLLAAVPPTDARVDCELLMALRGFPLREGAAIIAELALDVRLPPQVRVMAIKVLHRASEVTVVKSVARQVPAEQHHETREALLNLAVERSIALEREWLEQQINSETNCWSRGALMAAFIHALDQAEGNARELHLPFLLNRLQYAYAQFGDDGEAVAHEVARGYGRIGSGSWLWSQQSLRGLAFDFLERFISDQLAATAGHVRLAVAQLRFGPNPREKRLLCQTLDELLRRMRRETQRSLQLEMEAQSMEVARVLADVAVRHLLTYQPSCAPVQEVLAEKARDFGWVVFHDRIVDANGQELANLQVAEIDDSPADEERVLALVNGISEAKKSAILSRWLIVRVFKIETSHASANAVYSAIKDAASGVHGSVAAESMQELFPEGVPLQKNWRQYLYRGAKQLRSLPGGAALLSAIGQPESRRRQK